MRISNVDIWTNSKRFALLKVFETHIIIPQTQTYFFICFYCHVLRAQSIGIYLSNKLNWFDLLIESVQLDANFHIVRTSRLPLTTYEHT